MDPFLLIPLLSSLLAVLVIVRLALRWRQPGPFAARAEAEVVEVTASDIRVHRKNVVVHRILLRFVLPSGDMHVVDTTRPLSGWQKDALLPGRTAPIEYDPRDPDRFRIRFDELRRRSAAAAQPS
ncbi:MAG TPA: DUF3592 domain-containing protein [Nannocystis sp.]